MVFSPEPPDTSRIWLMGDLLTAVRTVNLSIPQNEVPLTVPSKACKDAGHRSADAVTSPEQALETLRSKPTPIELHRVLDYLLSSHDASPLKICRTGPAAARIINELVNTAIPDYADHDEEVSVKLVQCLRNLAGISAIVTKLRLLSSEPTDSVSTAKVAVYIPVLNDILSEDDLVRDLCEQNSNLLDSNSYATLARKEIVSLFASGKIVAAVAQAEDKGSKSSTEREGVWISCGREYCQWLGRNIYHLIISRLNANVDNLSTASALLTRGLAIGYPRQLMSSILGSALEDDVSSSLMAVARLISSSSTREQNRLIELVVQYCSLRYKLEHTPFATEVDDSMRSTATLLENMASNSQEILQRLAAWLSDAVRNCAEPIAARRAALATLRTDAKLLESIIAATMESFGDPIFLNHAPLVQQEACAQTILMAVDHLHKIKPDAVIRLARSSVHTNATTKRLGASSEQARVLGMVVFMGISQLVDKDKTPMDFKVEEVRTERARAYIGLVHTTKPIEPLTDLSRLRQRTSQVLPKSRTVASKSEKPKIKNDPPRATQTPGAALPQSSRIIELLDDDDGHDLRPYPKPDSDPDDEEEDPTLINRDKIKPPVYIRDLIAGLQDSENHDRYTMAIKTAAALIRRKTSFGREVIDHIAELQGCLINASDSFDQPNFVELRLQGMIALLIAAPNTVAPAYARQVFHGDYSLSQRATMLSAMGLAARELAGLKDEDDLNPSLVDSAFPSKRLPDRLHQIYAPETAVMQSITQKLEQSMTAPLAAEALDAATGPSALKVRTFSTRMEVAKNRKKIIPNALAKIMCEYFFTPLIGHWWAHDQASRSSHNVHQTPILLTTFLKTLALMLHASGPGTLSLPQMTTDFWDLLLHVRARATENVSIMGAVLFGLLTLLEVNENKRRIADEHSRQLIETQSWVFMVFERLSAGGPHTASRGPISDTDHEGNHVRMLASGVLLQLQEVSEKYSRLLMGDMMDY